MTTSPRARPVNPAILAFVVGFGLPFLLGVCALLLSRLYPESSCSHYTGCIGNFLEAWEIMRWTGLAVAWPMLAFLGVRPAWPMASATHRPSAPVRHTVIEPATWHSVAMGSGPGSSR